MIPVSVQYGSFVGPKTVQVEGVEYTADHILVAVGGRPTMPTMEGAEHCIDSNGFFQLEVRHYCTVSPGRIFYSLNYGIGHSYRRCSVLCRLWHQPSVVLPAVEPGTGLSFAVELGTFSTLFLSFVNRSDQPWTLVRFSSCASTGTDDKILWYFAAVPRCE